MQKKFSFFQNLFFFKIFHKFFWFENMKIFFGYIFFIIKNLIYDQKKLKKNFF